MQKADADSPPGRGELKGGLRSSPFLHENQPFPHTHQALEKFQNLRILSTATCTLSVWQWHVINDKDLLLSCGNKEDTSQHAEGFYGGGWFLGYVDLEKRQGEAHLFLTLR